MNKELPITIKNIALLIFLILLTSGLHYLITDLQGDKEVEAKVLLKNSKKGLYLYPRFEVLVEGSDNASMISKEKYESIKIGDKVSGYIRGEESFVTEDDIQFELMIGIPILISFYIILLLWITGMLNSTAFVKRREKLRRTIMFTFLGSVTAILTIYLIAGFIMTSLLATNVFNKLNKFNLTETEAIVLGGDWNRTRSHRGGSYTTYELFLLYSDEENELYVTKKAVTGPTYEAYDVDDEITLFYRNNNVNDTFVQAESFEEIWPAFVNMFTFFIGLYLVSVFFIIRHWRKKYRNNDNEQEVEVIHH